ncbi:MAG: hypothetical protein U1A78_29615 [Polyangia bacterium]
MKTGQVRILDADAPELRALLCAHDSLLDAVRALGAPGSEDAANAEETRNAVLVAARNFAQHQHATKQAGIGWLMADCLGAEASQQLIAYHEAGHFIAAYRCNLQVDTIRLVGSPIDSLSAGCVRLRQASGVHYYRWTYGAQPAHRKDLVRELAIFSLAGYHAQRRVQPSIVPIGCQQDLDEATRLLRLYNPSDTDEHQQHRFIDIDRCSQDIVYNSWSAVKALAAELSRVEHMDGADAYRIVEDALPVNEREQHAAEASSQARTVDGRQG